MAGLVREVKSNQAFGLGVPVVFHSARQRVLFFLRYLSCSGTLGTVGYGTHSGRVEVGVCTYLLTCNEIGHIETSVAASSVQQEEASDSSGVPG